MVARFVPEAGALIWLDFTPQSGHEQAGHRPGLVLTPRAYNKFGLVIVCPITSREKANPFQMELPEGLKTTGYVICNQIKTVDLITRKATFAGERVPAAFLKKVRHRIALLLELPWQE